MKLNLMEDTLSVFLEYVSEGSIHKLLQDYGPFMEPVIQNYTAQILSGLAYLHERNTLHRDIKGANILVDSNGGIKLADFGMAKHMSVQFYPPNSTVIDLLERVGRGSLSWSSYSFPLKEDLRPRLNHEPVCDPAHKLKMGDGRCRGAESNDTRQVT